MSARSGIDHPKDRGRQKLSGRHYAPWTRPTPAEKLWAAVHRAREVAKTKARLGL